jgi:hypothetical protein
MGLKTFGRHNSPVACNKGWRSAGRVFLTAVNLPILTWLARDWAWPPIDVDQGASHPMLPLSFDGGNRTMIKAVLKSVLSFVLSKPAVVKCENCWALEECALYFDTKNPANFPKDCPNRRTRISTRNSAIR